MLIQKFSGEGKTVGHYFTVYVSTGSNLASDLDVSSHSEFIVLVGHGQLSSSKILTTVTPQNKRKNYLQAWIFVAVRNRL